MTTNFVAAELHGLSDVNLGLGTCSFWQGRTRIHCRRSHKTEGFGETTPTLSTTTRKPHVKNSSRSGRRNDDRCRYPTRLWSGWRFDQSHHRRDSQVRWKTPLCALSK